MLQRHVIRCPLCHAPLGELPQATCDECRTAAHRACARELGARCATLGCSRSGPVRRSRSLSVPEHAPGVVAKAWRQLDGVQMLLGAILGLLIGWATIAADLTGSRPDDLGWLWLALSAVATTSLLASYYRAGFWAALFGTPGRGLR